VWVSAPWIIFSVAPAMAAPAELSVRHVALDGQLSHVAERKADERRASHKCQQDSADDQKPNFEQEDHESCYKKTDDHRLPDRDGKHAQAAKIGEANEVRT
jgi:hypothetical protein